MRKYLFFNHDIPDDYAIDAYKAFQRGAHTVRYYEWPGNVRSHKIILEMTIIEALLHPNPRIRAAAKRLQQNKEEKTNGATIQRDF